MNNILLVSALVFAVMTGFVSAGEIHEAARSGDLDLVKSLLANDQDRLNLADSKGFTPLHSAIAKGRYEVVSYLIIQGADMELKNRNGLRPLSWALDLGRSRIASLLIDSGANTSVKGYKNRTLLHTASRIGDKRIVGLLLERGAEVNALDRSGSSPLDLAIESTRPEIARLLFSRGGTTHSISFDKKECRIQLNRAVNQGSMAIFEVLAEMDMDLDFAFDNGHHLIHKAAANGQLPLVRLLVEDGVEVNSKAESNLTPLYLATKHGHKDVADYLIAKGGTPGEIDEACFGPSAQLRQVLNDREAFVWYLNHSGWAIKTKEHLLIFDYVETSRNPVSGLISAGHLSPAELENLNVSVFVSHGHGDHYDSDILNWRESLPTVRYVLGFKPQGIDAGLYQYLPPRTVRNIGGMVISTLESSDAGVAFLIEVDGLTIYHSGDHANNTPSPSQAYKDEIAFIAGDNQEIDMAFVLSGASCGSGADDTGCVLSGNLHVIDRLQPKVVFPMHSGGNEYVYQEFKAEAAKKGYDTNIICAQYRGDRYHYLNGLLTQ